ncbi:MAG: hypothetical protein ACRCY9_11450 [Phycicoccus sp.]
MTTLHVHIPEPGLVKIWALWDAGDLISLHATEQGARDAREAHLHQLGPRHADDQELTERAVQVRHIHLEVP